MTKREFNKLGMYRAVIALFDANASKLTPIPALVQTVADFNSLIKEIEEGDFKFKKRTTDETMSKNMKEDKLHSHIIKIANALFTLGVQTGNANLMVQAKITKRELGRVRDKQLINTCTIILEKANAYHTALAGYGISAAMLADAQAALADFSEAIAAQDEEYADTSADRVLLSEMFAKASAKLNNELDPMMELFSESDAEFYHSYRSARIIKDRGLRHEDKPEGNTTN